MSEGEAQTDERGHYNDEGVSANYESAFFYGNEDYQRHLISNLLPCLSLGSPTRDGEEYTPNIADVGGGTGNFTQAIASALKMKEGEKILCVDPFEEMLKQAEAYKNVEPLLLDAMSFSALSDRIFDSILFKEVIHHVSEGDFEKLMTGTYHQLKSGGRMIIITRPQEVDYPFFPRAREIWKQYQPSSELIQTSMQKCRFEVNVQEVDYPVSLPKVTWLQMVRNKFWSTFSHCSEDELNEGLAYLKDKHRTEEILNFTDRMLFVVGTKL